MIVDEKTPIRLLHLGFTPGVDFVVTYDETGFGFQWLSKIASCPPEDIIMSAPTFYPVYEVTAAQARLALLDAGLLDVVTQAATSHPVKAVGIWYEYALKWEFDNPYVQALAIEIGLTDANIVGLFYAASLK